jgi:hypothetical protein
MHITDVNKDYIYGYIYIACDCPGFVENGLTACATAISILQLYIINEAND